MAQANSAAAQVGSVLASMNQLFTPGAGGCLYVMHQALNVEDQNIGVLQNTFTVICNVVITSEQKMHHLSQNSTAQFIRISSTNSPRGNFEVRLSTLTNDLDRVQHITGGDIFNAVVGYFKSVTDVTVWVQANIPSDNLKSEHFVDLDILLEGI